VKNLALNCPVLKHDIVKNLWTRFGNIQGQNSKQKYRAVQVLASHTYTRSLQEFCVVNWHHLCEWCSSHDHNFKKYSLSLHKHCLMKHASLSTLPYKRLSRSTQTMVLLLQTYSEIGNLR